MSKPKNIAAYPLVFLDVLDQLMEHPEEPVILPCNTEAEAKDFRLLFYGFRRAYVQANKHLEPSGFRDIETLSCTIQARLNEWLLIISHRDFSDFSTRMQEAVAEAKERANLKAFKRASD